MKKYILFTVFLCLHNISSADVRQLDPNYLQKQIERNKEIAQKYDGVTVEEARQELRQKFCSTVCAYMRVFASAPRFPVGGETPDYRSKINKAKKESENFIDAFYGYIFCKRRK